MSILTVTQRARATTEASADSGKWFNDSVLNTPTQAREQPKYDSDDDISSLVSEPGSPQDVNMESGEDDDMAETLSQSPEDAFMSRPALISGHIMGQRLQTNRVPTPMVPMRPGASPDRIRTGFKQHVRRRHPQEYSASSNDLLEVPSPIDEDGVPTPPSAAEAAGSQLSMLSVSDVDMDATTSYDIPRISIDPARPSPSTTHIGPNAELDMEPTYGGPESIVVRKQRQRSGALSSGNSPVRAPPGPSNMAAKRGFSMGFRADCDKCRNRVPGHMNHFN